MAGKHVKSTYCLYNLRENEWSTQEMHLVDLNNWDVRDIRRLSPV